MKRSLPPLGWLRTFEAAARHLNFTAAASELAMTQSAVSQQIRSLELRLGGNLFERKPRGLALTERGRTLLPKVGSAFQTLESALGGLDTQNTEHRLTIATSVSVAQWLLAPHLKSFTAQHPGIRLQLMSSIWPDEFRQLRADVEIRFGSQKQVGEGAERLQPDGLIAVAAANSEATVVSGPLIEAVGTTEGWRQWGEAAAYGVELTPTFRVDSYGLALDLAHRGQGVALASALIARKMLASGELKQVDPFQLANTEGYFVAVNAQTAPVQAFAGWLKSLVSAA